jgi:hypothetical protein
MAVNRIFVLRRVPSPDDAPSAPLIPSFGVESPPTSVLFLGEAVPEKTRWHGGSRHGFFSGGGGGGREVSGSIGGKSGVRPINLSGLPVRKKAERAGPTSLASLQQR